jgi:hypothetical protein
LRISCAKRSSNRERIVEVLHRDVPRRKRSEISKEGSSLLLGYFGVGLNLVKYESRQWSIWGDESGLKPAGTTQR